MKNVILVSKKSLLQLASESTTYEKLARNLDADLLKRTHEEQLMTLKTVTESLLKANIRFESVSLDRLRPISEVDGVIVVGGDGTFIRTSHFVDRIPILGVNSDVKTSRGFFCFADRASFESILNQWSELPLTNVSRIELSLDGRLLPSLGLNDILIAHSNPAAMSRYRLDDGKVCQEFRSSGLLVSTAAGSTAWIFNTGGKVMELSSNELQFHSREVFGDGFHLTDTPLKVISLMNEGMIYVDCDSASYDFSTGSELILKSGSPLKVVGDINVKRSRLLTSLDKAQIGFRANQVQ